MSPFELIPWAIAIGLAWFLLCGLTGLDTWLKKLAGRKDSTPELEARIAVLEKRVEELEKR